MTELSNLKLAKRWGVYPSTIYGWRKDEKRAKALEILRIGAAQPEKRTLLSSGEFEHECHTRGFSGAELVRDTGFARNTIKSWMQNEKRIGLLWDLLRGYEQYVVSR